MRVKSNDSLVLLVLLLIGAIFGSLIGAALGDTVPILNFGKSIGVDPFVVDLNIIVITIPIMPAILRLSLKPNVIAFIVYKKL